MFREFPYSYYKLTSGYFKTDCTNLLCPNFLVKLRSLWQLPCLDNLELFQAKAIHHSYARHSHPSYSIGVIEAGIGGNYYRGATHVAEPDSIIFMNPDEAHTGYCVDNLPLIYRMLYYSTSLLQSITDDLGAKIAYFPETIVHDKNLARKIQNLHCILETSQNPLERDTLFVEVLSQTVAHHADIKVNLTQIKLEFGVIRLIKDYLHDKYNSNISLEQLVELTNLNCFYLIRLFRDAVGLPPYAYLTQIRVERAKQLLREGKSIALGGFYTRYVRLKPFI